MMKKSIHCFVFLFVVFCFTKCSEPIREGVSSYSEIKKANWLIGSWHNVSANEVSTEIWKKKNDSIFTGLSFVIVNKDTVSYETISLEQKENLLYYIPSVKEQNQGQAVEFALINSTVDQLVFEDPQHDFPQKITYNKISNDSLLAEISGILNGEQKTIQFPFVRVK